MTREAVTVSEVTDRAGLTGIRQEWQALMLEARDATPFQSWEWCDAWNRHFAGDGLFILVARASERTVGILPLGWSRRFGLPLRTLVFLGSHAADFCNGILLPGWEQACVDAFFAHLAQQRRRWDLLDLEHVSQGTALADAAAPTGLRARRSLCRVCLVTPLPGSWESLLAQLSANMRGNIRRKRRLMERDFKSVQFDVATGAERPAALEDMFRMNRERWNSRRGEGSSFFDDPQMRRFQQDVAGAFEDHGWLRLHRLRLDGVTRAVGYFLRFGDRVDFYNASFDMQLSPYSPGTTILARVIEDEIGHGAHEFAFGRGNATYKYEWKPVERPSHRLVLCHGSLRSRLAFALARVYSYFEERNIGYWFHNLLWGHRSLPVQVRNRWRRLAQDFRRARATVPPPPAPPTDAASAGPGPRQANERREGHHRGK